jgi:hypothetical protein
VLRVTLSQVSVADNIRRMSSKSTVKSKLDGDDTRLSGISRAEERIMNNTESGLQIPGSGNSSLRSLEDMKIAATGGDKKEDFSDDEENSRISAPSTAMEFQPLLPISEAKQAPEPTRRLRSHTRGEIPALPKLSSQTVVAQDSSRASSAAASPVNGFMNNMPDPVAATAGVSSMAASLSASSKANQLSHTPPTNAASSYETSHFGKRPRSGVSNTVADSLLFVHAIPNSLCL